MNRKNPLKDRLLSGAFTITAEVVPPLAGSPAPLLARVEPLRGRVTAVNVTDGAGAKTSMSSLAAAAILAANGFEPVLQLTCRDRNRIALAADLVGAAALGIVNILPLFGDDPTHGDQPEATSVHDFNTQELIRLARTMRDDGTLPSGRHIEAAPDFFIGAADVPRDLSRVKAPPRLLEKIDAGAEFVQTQFCFDLDLIRAYVDGLDRHGLLERTPILIGLGPISSARSARWMRENLWGTAIPDAVIQRIADAPDETDAGRAVCLELMQALHEMPGVAGVHLMAPRDDAACVAAMIADSGLQ
ncbi:MAG: methylenetetrahydrofolate reductase [Gammaproteobacteria bacterium]|nr:methylenetetrahydrofolate reductase [Gammaproteobacteria bacterium]